MTLPPSPPPLAKGGWGDLEMYFLSNSNVSSSNAETRIVWVIENWDLEFVCDLGFGISYGRTPLVIYKVIHGV